MLAAAKKFIKEYGMLEIYLPNVRPGGSEEYIENHNLSKFTLHTTNMVNSFVNGLMSRDYVDEYEEYVEEKLVIVGKLADAHQYLMISESEKLFTEYGFFGSNAEEFWDRLINDGAGIFTSWVHWGG